MNKINLLEPDITRVEKKELKNAIDKNYISTFGDITNKTKDVIKHLINCKYLELSNSGSSALILAIKSIIKGRNELIITSNYTFIATINSIIHCGHKPWIFDVEDKYFSIDFDKLEKTLRTETYFKNGYTYNIHSNRKISCILIVFFAGIMPDLNRLLKISRKYNLKTIIDCAGSFFTLVDNHNLLQKIDIAITSFNGNKSITAGSGGAIFSNKSKFAKIFNHLIDNSKINKTYAHLDFGFNFKISNLHSSILLGQLKRYDEIYKKKKYIYNYYSEKIVSNNYNFLKTKDLIWQNFIILKSNINKFNFLKKANKKGINLKDFWIPMSKQYKIKKFMLFDKDISLTKKLERIIPLPSSSFLKKKELDKVINFLNNYK